MTGNNHCCFARPNFYEGELFAVLDNCSQGVVFTEIAPGKRVMAPTMSCLIPPNSLSAMLLLLLLLLLAACCPCSMLSFCLHPALCCSMSAHC
jgi:hypothetical protein